MKMTIQEFHAGMKKHFPKITNRGEYLCNVSLMYKLIRIDVMKLDDWLHQIHGEYEDEGLSMAELITREYGQKAHDFVLNLL